MRNPPAFTPQEENPPALNQPMQTRSTRNKFKAEVRSKQNEERHKPSGKTPKDPEMNPVGSAELPPEGFEDFGEDENVASQRPPYLSPIQLGFQPPQWTAKFTLRTPSLPQGVKLVGTMTSKIDRLKYTDHDTNNRGKFSEFAPGTYLHSIHYSETGSMLLEVKQ